MVGDEASSLTDAPVSEPQAPAHNKKIRIELGNITVQNIGQLRQLNTVIFPVTYSDRFYKEAIEMGEYCKLAYCNDISVGGVCCRLDVVSKETGEIGKLYIATLGVLAPYRHYGIGSYLLEHVLYHAKLSQKARAHSADGVNCLPIKEISLHIQVSNTDGLAWYKKRGFEIVSEVKDYYKKARPADAYLLKKMV